MVIVCGVPSTMDLPWLTVCSVASSPSTLYRLHL